MPHQVNIGSTQGTMKGNNKHKAQCNHCGKQILGGEITRLELHLSGGFVNVDCCSNCPNEDRAILPKCIKGKTVKTVKTEKGRTVKGKNVKTVKTNKGKPAKTVQTNKGKTVKRRRTNKEPNMMMPGTSYGDIVDGEEEDDYVLELQRAIHLSRANVHERDLEQKLDHNISPHFSSEARTSTLLGGMPHLANIGSAHGTMRHEVQGNHYGKQIFGEGITMLKQHLAGGFDNWLKCPDEVRAFFPTHVNGRTAKRMRTDEELNAVTLIDDDDKEDENERELQRGLHLSRADMHERELKRRLDHNNLTHFSSGAGAGAGTLPGEVNLGLGLQSNESGSCRCQTILRDLNNENEKLKQKLQEMKQKALHDAMKISDLQKKLEEKDNDMEYIESVNQTLIAKDRESSDELNEARNDLIRILTDYPSDRGSIIGIKRMGDLDLKPFRDVCLQKFSQEEADIKAVELCSLWQENLKNPHWHPFKRIRIDDKFHEVIDDNDAKLKKLKDTWGEKVQKAVSVALSEINEYNPSGRYVKAELWNFKKGRKCSLKEAMNYMLRMKKPESGPFLLC